MLQNYLMFAFLAPKRVSKSRSFPKACRVERGEIKNVLFRFLARLVVGFAGTVEALLRDLGVPKLPQEALPRLKSLIGEESPTACGQAPKESGFVLRPFAAVE